MLGAKKPMVVKIVAFLKSHEPNMVELKFI
jgi:hypothetical protein